MIRRLTTISLVVSGLFSLVMILVRAQPQHDFDLRELFTTSGSCPAPCFIGIHPGRTTVAEAAQILNAHPWVRETSLQVDTVFREGNLSWKWSGLQPPQFLTEAEGILRICGDLVCSLSLPTAVEFGWLRLALGTPDSETLRSFRDRGQTVVLHTAIYDALQLSVRTSGFCPPDVTAMALQRNLATIEMGSIIDTVAPTIPMRPPRYQIISFEKRSYGWLRRRAFVCAG